MGNVTSCGSSKDNSILIQFIRDNGVRFLKLAEALKRAQISLTRGEKFSYKYTNHLVKNFKFDPDSTLWHTLETNTEGQVYTARQLLEMHKIALSSQYAPFFSQGGGKGWCEALKEISSISFTHIGFCSDWNIVLYKDLFIMNDVLGYIIKQRLKTEFTAVGKTVAGPNIKTVGPKLKHFICTYRTILDLGVSNWAYPYLTTQDYPGLV